MEQEALQLARLHGIPLKEASTAALLHDCAKEIPFEEMQEIAYRENLAIDKSWINCKKMAAARVAIMFFIFLYQNFISYQSSNA